MKVHHPVVEFRILGPLEVVEADQVVRLGGVKQRALLALLLVHAGQAVSRDELIEQLWHGRPPATASVTLRAYVSRLRAIVGAGRLKIRPPGYLLALADDEFDVWLFERLLVEARRAPVRERGARLREALALWRGGALADFAYEPFAAAEIGRLEEMRLSAIEERIDADLELGQHAAIVGELEALVRAYPLRERLRGQQMLTLYRSGRQAEALESYRKLRSLLAGELGLEPSSDIRALERAILAQDPALAMHGRLEEEQDSGGLGYSDAFVGRERELVELFAGLDRAVAGRGGIVLVSGEPGIGKTRLADKLAAEAARRGAGVLIGRCWEAGGAPPFWPWVQALRAYVAAQEPQVLRDQLGLGASDLAQILPELNTLYDDLPAPPSTDPEGARFRLFEATASFVRRASIERPLVLVLDDLHAADASSLLLLRFLGGALAHSRLLVVGCYRDVDPALGDPLAATLAELSRRPETVLVQLGGLSESDVASFIAQAAGLEPSRAVVSAIRDRSDGNPLFLGEMVRLLQAEEASSTMFDPEARLAVPEGIRAVIASRLRHLPEPSRQALELASVLGIEFGLDALEEVSELPPDDLLATLDQAVRERIVAEVQGARGRLRFAHTLIRDSIYEALPPGRRVKLHRTVGEALERLYADNLEPHLAELALHFHESARPADAQKALDFARRAAQRSLHLLAYEEAARLFGVALRVLESGNAHNEATRCELLLAIGDAEARAGDMATAKRTYRRAAELAEALGLHEHLARAALGYGGRLVWEASRDDPELQPLLERALAALDDKDSVLRVKLQARLAAGPLRDSTTVPEQRHELGAQALAMARRIGEPSTLAYALVGYMGCNSSPAFTPEQPALATELVELALEIGELERAVEGLEASIEAAIELADLTKARADLKTMIELVDELRQPAQRWVVSVYQACLALFEGQLEDAERLVAEADRLGSEIHLWAASAAHSLQLYLLRREQGRLAEIEDAVRHAADANATYPVFRCALVAALAELGSSAEAERELDALASRGFGDIPFDEEWLVSLCLLAEAAARLEERNHAATLYDLLGPYSDRIALAYTEISLGPVARPLALLSGILAQPDKAEKHFLDAIELSERTGARPWLARSQAEYAQLLLTRERPGHTLEAQQLLESAAATYEELGLTSSVVTPPKASPRS